jgi:hypothetical protein
MNNQLNELSKGDKAGGGRGRYNLRSDKRETTPDIPDPSTREERPSNEVAYNHRGKKTQPLSPIIPNHVPEIREIPNLCLLSISNMRSKRSEFLCPSLS